MRAWLSASRGLRGPPWQLLSDAGKVSGFNAKGLERILKRSLVPKGGGITRHGDRTRWQKELHGVARSERPLDTTRLGGAQGARQSPGNLAAGFPTLEGAFMAG